ncbi:MAG: CHAT domain-containing protein [Planctomycetota bacterium]
MRCGRAIGCLAVLTLAAAPAGAAEVTSPGGAPPNPAVASGAGGSTGAPRAEKAATPSEAAAAVREAVKARDGAALARLRAAEAPDPWLVVDALDAAGALDAAALLTSGIAREDAPALRAYVAARRAGAADPAETRARVVAAAKAAEAGRPGGDVLALLDGVSPPTDTVLAVEAARVRLDALRRAGRRVEAVEVGEAAAGVASRLGWTRGEVTALRDAGVVAQATGDARTALRLFQRLLVLEERLGATGAATLCEIGRAQSTLGDVASARATLERALAAAKEHDEVGTYATALGDLADIHFRLGDYPRAVGMHRDALAQRRSVGDRPGVARSLDHLAGVQAALGAWAKAFELAEAARTEAAAIGDDLVLATVMSTVGSFHSRLGQYPEAATLYRAALEVFRRLDARASAVNALTALGVVHLKSGDLEQALKDFDEVVPQAEALGDPALVAEIRRHRGEAFQALGELPKAAVEFEAAIAGFEAAQHRRGAAATVADLARLRLEAGEYAAARKLADRAVREAERMRADPLLASALAVRAQTRIAAGDPDAALEIAKQGAQIVDRLFTGLGAAQAGAARETVAPVFEVGALAAVRVADATELSYFVESGRAGALMETLGVRERVQRAAVPPSLLAEREALRTTEKAAASAYAATLAGDDLAATRRARSELDAVRAKGLDLAARIERASKREESWDHRGATLEEIQGHLTPGEAFVAFVLPNPDAAALVVTSTSARVVRLGLTSDVVAACEALHASDPDEDASAALARLEEVVVKPLGLGADVTTLLLSPEGPLCYVPFSALMRGRDVVFVPSGTTLTYLLDSREAPGTQVLALGDPDYGSAGSSAAGAVFGATRDGAPAPAPTPKPDVRGGRLVPLPETRVEAKAVGDVLLLGQEATEAGLRHAIATRPRWKAVHVACHGLVDRDRPELSALALTPSDADDGFLTAMEVVAMAVPSDVVVLSACETGTGKVRRGEGLSGLMRAFLAAGSPRVVCSLWKVDDEATRALMIRFYELWNPKDGSAPMGASLALRAAQERVRADPRWKHPYYWAAWVLWGLP